MNVLTSWINKLTKSAYLEYNNINLVFDGGIFSGSYQIGVLLYFIELQKQKKCNIDKISGCSIGAFTALCWFLDDTEVVLELVDDIYRATVQQLRLNQNLNIFAYIFRRIRPLITPTVLAAMNGRLFVSYFDAKTAKHVDCSHYKSEAHLFEILRRSCSLPFLVDGNVFYRGRYVDGFYPHIFEDENAVFVSLVTPKTLTKLVSVKGDDNFKRIMCGVLDAHLFCKTGKSKMCSLITNKFCMAHIQCTQFFFEIVAKLLQQLYNINKFIETGGESEGFVACDKNERGKFLKKGDGTMHGILREIYAFIIRNYCV